MSKDEQIMKLESIEELIFLIRGQKVILSPNLAELYGVETGQLKRAVRRNKERFSPDFMFELEKAEFENLRCHFGISSWGEIRYMPMAFAEQGVAMFTPLNAVPL